MIVQVIIEIPQGSQNKYEYDVATGTMRLDRVLYSAMHYPVNYGFVPDTWAEDNDPLDVLVFGSTAIHPGVDVNVRVLGTLWMEDEHGPDTKLVGVVDADPRYAHIKQVDDLGAHRLVEVRHFFQEYKKLQGLTATLGDYHNKDTAEQVLTDARIRYQQRLADADKDGIGKLRQ